MKKIIIISIFCIAILGLSLFNNTSFNKDKQHKDSIESHKDSLLLRQSEILDSLIQETMVFDSICMVYKSSNSIIKAEIMNVKDNSENILKLQKKILQKNK